jgi:hypothetical protein
MGAMMRIFARSCAMTKSVGALKLDTTVLPTSTCLKMTMPSMGEVSVQRSRSRRAFCTAALRVSSVARDCSSCASIWS